MVEPFVATFCKFLSHSVNFAGEDDKADESTSSESDSLPPEEEGSDERSRSTQFDHFGIVSES